MEHPTSGRPKLSVGLPPSRRIVEYARVAESLDYHAMWVYDSPALYGDLWMAVGRVAEATRLRLGTAVAVPSVRHPMVTASAIATVEELAPGRLTVAFGTGFSARKAMGRRPMRWADLAEYVRQVRALLSGEVVDIDGSACQMLHPAGYAPKRPIGTPLLVAPSGPKGYEVARALGAGVMLTGVPDATEHDWPFIAIIMSGTVVRPGEDHTSERLVQAVAPWFGTGYHAMWEYAPAALDTMPGGREWRDAMLAARPERERHLAVHEGHVTVLPERDLAAVRAAGALIMQHGWTGDAAAVRARFVAAGDAGVDEVVYCAAGPDIEGELRAFAEAVR
jgi:5,10-methylenetetrahydromethanopterin reductase